MDSFTPRTLHTRGVNVFMNPSYFNDREKNNKQRIKQFELDGKFMRTHVAEGVICDIGCGTGEFLDQIQWSNTMYGMEISDYAKHSAIQRGINFSRNILTEHNFFDVVLFRGSLQDLDEPFRMLKEAHEALKPGGSLVILSFPNTRSPLYLTKQNLPFLGNEANFLLASPKILINALRNIGFAVTATDFPYWHTPYRRLMTDHIKFALNLCAPKHFFPHAFWRSQLALVAVKSNTP